MAAVTREDVANSHPVSNDTELDIEVGRVAEEQKRETGTSDDAAAIKSRLLAEGFKRNVVNPESTEEDMRAGHEDSVKAFDEDEKNLAENPAVVHEAKPETEEKSKKSK